jgi:hypothetical protein
MKKSLLFISMAMMAMLAGAQVETEIVTGAGYPDEVFYSLEDGVVATESRATWDLGFTTSNFSVSILANTASGVEVYTYPLGDTADWANLDTTGMTWVPMYNSLETRDEGAFSANATGHPDYGWGIYNMTTHNITGDSLFVIKTVAGEYKKLSIVQRGAIANTWSFKVAGLDGSNDSTVVLNSGEYSGKSFVYYSLDNMEILDREPATETWDLLFTRYWDYTIPFMVSGVVTNEAHVMAQKVQQEGMDRETFVEFEDSAFTSMLTEIGSDWKSFNMGTFSYDVDTTVVYFLKKYGETDSSYYKLYFTAFEYTEGTYVFVQEELTPVSSRAPLPSVLMQVYPNPATDVLNLVYDHTGEMEVNIFDATGRVVLSSSHRGSGFNRLTLNISSLDRGIFFVKVKAGEATDVLRFIKQ